MLIGDEFWRLFGCDDGPGVAWCAAGLVIVFVLPTAPLLVGIGLDWWRGE